MSAPRKARKIYYIDPLLYQVTGGFLRGIRNTFQWWKDEIDNNTLKGNIFESVVINHMARKRDRAYYWYSSNTQKEVDLLFDDSGKLSLYEIKSSSTNVAKTVLGKKVNIITPTGFLNNQLQKQN